MEQCFTAVPRNPSTALGLTALNPPKQREDDHNQEDQSNPAKRVIAPAGAVGPGGKRSDEEKDENEYQDGSHRIFN